MDGKFSSKVARSAVVAGLALAMAASPVIPATVALADTTYGTGSITINKVEGNDTTFTGYQIFKAKVTDSANSKTKSVSDVAWANDDVKAAVEGVINKQDDAYTGTTAQDAADWITAHVTGTTKETAVASDSVAEAIAKAVMGLTTTTTVTPDDPTTLTEGYWLFVTTHSTLGDGEAATAPIFAVVGGTGVTVTEKDTVPTVKKTLADSKTTSGSTGVGKVIDYKLEGTVASNIDTYDTYAYTFNDTLSDGLDYVDSSATVMVDGKNVTKQATITYKDHKLTIGFTDLKKVATLNKESKVTVDYQAKVNEHAVAGTDSNLNNTVSLIYSNDPHSDGTGTTTHNSTVKEYTYKLKLVKRDRDTEKTLDGAKFTIKSGDKFVQADGSLGDKEKVFTASGDNGFTVNGLDAGTYTVTEKDAPTGYDKTGAFTFTITPTIENDVLTGLDNTVKDNTDVIAGESNNTPGDHQLQAKDGTAANVKTGTVTVTVGDKKEITMPLTGMKGTTALIVYGSAILVISAAAYIKHRRGAADSE